MRVLTLLLYRPELCPPWTAHAHCSQPTLSRFTRSQVEQMLAYLTRDQPLPEAVRGQVIARADGVPLFIEELVKMLLEAARQPAGTGHNGRTTRRPLLVIPPTLGLRLLTEALEAVDCSGERSWAAEVHRLKGELLLRQADRALLQSAATEEAEAWLHRAIAVARRQEAKVLELRAAMSLARLWKQQGKRTEAQELLAPIYGWFTEGFDTADLQEARALLKTLCV